LRPYISYYDATKEDLKFAYKSPIDAWVITTVDNPDLIEEVDVGLYTSIVLKNPGEPLITYYDATNGNLKYTYSTDLYGVVQPPLWTIDVVDASINDVGRYGSLKRYSGDGSLHVCYYDATDKDLMYAKGTGAPVTWAIEKVDTSGDVGLFCSIGLDGAGHQAISYYDNTYGDLKLALDSGFVLPVLLPKLWLPIIRH